LNKTLAVIFIVVAAMLLQSPAMEAQNATPAGNVANGKIAFMKVGCYSCHGTMGHGGPGGRLAPMSLSNRTFMNTVRNGKKDADQSEYWDGMPAFSARFISDSELADIYAYLAGIPSPPPVKDIPLLKN
jgi:mono/diheme cytochrome c family protein